MLHATGQATSGESGWHRATHISRNAQVSIMIARADQHHDYLGFNAMAWPQAAQSVDVSALSMAGLAKQSSFADAIDLPNRDVLRVRSPNEDTPEQIKVRDEAVAALTKLRDEVDAQLKVLKAHAKEGGADEQIAALEGQLAMLDLQISIAQHGPIQMAAAVAANMQNFAGTTHDNTKNAVTGGNVQIGTTFAEMTIEAIEGMSLTQINSLSVDDIYSMNAKQLKAFNGAIIERTGEIADRSSSELVEKEKQLEAEGKEKEAEAMRQQRIKLEEDRRKAEKDGDAVASARAAAQLALLNGDRKGYEEARDAMQQAAIAKAKEEGKSKEEAVAAGEAAVDDLNIRTGVMAKEIKANGADVETVSAELAEKAKIWADLAERGVANSAIKESEAAKAALIIQNDRKEELPSPSDFSSTALPAVKSTTATLPEFLDVALPELPAIDTKAINIDVLRVAGLEMKKANIVDANGENNASDEKEVALSKDIKLAEADPDEVKKPNVKDQTEKQTGKTV